MSNVYYHQVQYYETDSMRIVHHSNYIRWFEEARLNGMAEDGFGYDEMEKRGIIIPVLSASCDYKVSATYGKTVKITYEMDFFNGLRFGLSYRVTSEDDSVLHAEGKTTHCFLNRDMKPMNIKKYAPDVYEYFVGMTPAEKVTDPAHRHHAGQKK